MLKRIITAIVLLVIFVPALVWGGPVVSTSVFAILSGFSVYEMLGCCGLQKNFWIAIPTLLAAMATVFVPMVFELRIFGMAAVLLAALILALMYYLGVALFCYKKVDVERVLMMFGLAVYIIAGFTALSALNYLYGLWAVAFVLCIAWFTDTFAYFSGMLFGKRKLCPDISPKKTVAGAIGGTLFGTLIGMAIFSWACGFSAYAFCALPFSIASQCGDLVASITKRRFDVKDYGKIFPGHGGVLDRFDSVIPVAILTALLFLGYWIVVWVI